MKNKEILAKRDAYIHSIADKYGEWLEMSDRPEFMLIDILAALLIKSESEIEYLKSIAYKD